MKYLMANVKCLRCTTEDCKKQLNYNFIEVDFCNNNMECNIFLGCFGKAQLLKLLKKELPENANMTKYMRYLNSNTIRRMNTNNGFIIYFKKPTVNTINNDAIIENQFNKWLSEKYLKGTYSLDTALKYYKYARNKAKHYNTIKCISNAMYSFYIALNSKCYNVEKWYNNIDKANLSIAEIKEFAEIFTSEYFKKKDQYIKGAILNTDGYLYVLGYSFTSGHESVIKVDMNTKSIIKEYLATHDCPVRLIYGKYDNLYDN